MWRRSMRMVQGAFAIALAFLLVIGLISYRNVNRLAEERDRAEHTHRVIRQLNAVLVTVADAASAQRGFIITGNEADLGAFSGAVRLNQSVLDELRQLPAGDSSQQQQLDAISDLLKRRFAQMDVVIQMRRSRGFEAALRELATAESLRVQSELSSLIRGMESREQSLLRERERNMARGAVITKIVIVSGASLAFVFVALALIAIRRDFVGRERAEAQLDRFFSLSLDFLGIASGDCYFKRVSPAVTEILGWSVSEFLARPFTSFVHPDDLAATLREVEKQIVAGERVLNFENRYRHKDGSWRVLSWRSMPQPDGLLFATARDVTELRSQEQALRDAKEQLELRVQERTAELQQTALNLELEVAERNAAQLELQAQLRRLNLLHLIARATDERQDIRSVSAIVVNTLETQLPVDYACLLLLDAASDNLVVTSLGGHGSTLAAESGLQENVSVGAAEMGLTTCMQGRLLYVPNISALRLALMEQLASAGLRSLVGAPLVVESNVLGVLLAARLDAHGFDDGEREFLQQLGEQVALAAHQAKLHSALQVAYDDLRHTQQAVMQHERLRVLGKMASGIAHDINNSITPASIYTHLLLERETNLSVQARDFLITIQRAIHDVAETVARMREFYRQGDSRAMTPLQINALLSHVVELTRVRWADMAQQSGVVIDLQMELADELPLVMGVQSEIREALTNLVINAVDAMPQGGKLVLRTSVTDDDKPSQDASRSAGRRVQVAVIDTGIGMDEETRRHCLELFYTTKGERGTGLGLAMVYGTMERHGGGIDVTSALGQGTTIRLSFPVASSDASIQSSAPLKALRKLRILVIDDDPVLLHSLYQMLQGDGHTVCAASGGEQGIAMFRAIVDTAAAFDIVLTDLGMPYVDGRQVVSAIKSAAPATPVIMLTGWGQRLHAEGDVPLVDRVLGKPPRVHELRAALLELTTPDDLEDDSRSYAAGERMSTYENS